MYTPGDLSGQTWLLTGSNDGIGLHTAHGLVAMGATLLAHARSADKAQATAAALRAARPSATVIPVWGDLSSQAEVHALGGQILAQAPKLHGLLHNAGALFSTYAPTVDGVERQLAVNHLAPFLLTHLLWPRLRATGPGRVVVVSSMAHYKGQIDWSDLNHSQRYDAQKVYRFTKLANVLFTRQLAQKGRADGITVNCLHPGVVATRIADKMAWWAGLAWLAIRPFQISAEAGAKTSLYCAASPDLAGITGCYFDKCKQKEPSTLAQDPAAAQRLWEESERLVKLQADETID